MGNTGTSSGVSGGLSIGQKIEGNITQPRSIIVNDYELLINHPYIEGNELIGDKTFLELGLYTVTPQEIDEIIFGGN